MRGRLDAGECKMAWKMLCFTTELDAKIRDVRWQAQAMFTLACLAPYDNDG